MQRPSVLFTLVAGALGAGVAFVGCSSDDDSSTSVTAGPASSAESSSASATSSSASTGGGSGAQGGGGSGATGGMGGEAGSGGGPGETSCTNGVDDDGDNLVDCEDAADCGSDAACPLVATCGSATPALPTNAGDTTNGTTLFSASCTGDERVPESVYTYTPPADGVLQLQLSSALSIDLGLYARATCNEPATELACSDGIGSDEALDVPAVTGAPIAIFVDGHSPLDTGTFSLQTSFLPTTEVEPNGTTAQANAYLAAPAYTGTIYPAGDLDVVAVVVPAGTTQIVAETVDLGSGACMKKLLDSGVEILGTDGTTSLALDDDGGDGFCARATATVSAAGTYFVRVSAGPVNPDFVFGYELDVSLM